MITELPCVVPDIPSVFQSLADEYTSSELAGTYLDWFNWCDKPLDRERIAYLLASDDGVISATASNERVCVKFTIVPLTGRDRAQTEYRFYALESVWHYHTDDARRHLTTLATENVVSHCYHFHRVTQDPSPGDHR